MAAPVLCSQFLRGVGVAVFALMRAGVILPDVLAHHAATGRPLPLVGHLLLLYGCHSIILSALEVNNVDTIRFLHYNSKKTIFPFISHQYNGIDSRGYSIGLPGIFIFSTISFSIFSTISLIRPIPLWYSLTFPKVKCSSDSLLWTTLLRRE